MFFLFFGYCVFSFVARVYFCVPPILWNVYGWWGKNVILSCSLLGETSAGIMCYINQVTHSVGYPRFVFTNNTPYGRPSNNNILVRFDTFCSLGETHHTMRIVVWSAPSTVFHTCIGFWQTDFYRYPFLKMAFQCACANEKEWVIERIGTQRCLFCYFVSLENTPKPNS